MENKKNFLKIKSFFCCGKLELTIERGNEGSFSTVFIKVNNKHIKNDMDVICLLRNIATRVSKKFGKDYTYHSENREVTFDFGYDPMSIRRLNSKTTLTFINKIVESYK